MSPRQLVALVILLCVSIVCISGCTGSSSSAEKTHASNTFVTTLPTTVPPTTVPPTTLSPPTVEEIFSDYYDSYLQINEDKIWNLLSTNAKSDTSKDSIYNHIYAFRKSGIRPYEYEITKIDENGKTATMNVDIKRLVNGYKTTFTQEVPFVFESGGWKIDKFVQL